MIIDELNKKIADIESLANDKTSTIESKVSDLTDGLLMVADAVDIIPEMVDEKITAITKEFSTIKDSVKKVKAQKGDNGRDGIDGLDGLNGRDGKDGVTYTNNSPRMITKDQIRNEVTKIENSTEYQNEKAIMNDWLNGKIKDLPETPSTDLRALWLNADKPKHTVLFDNSKLLTKQQLKDIWNKANKKILPKNTKLIRNKDGSVEYGSQKMSGDFKGMPDIEIIKMFDNTPF